MDEGLGSYRMSNLNGENEFLMNDPESSNKSKILRAYKITTAEERDCLS